MSGKELINPLYNSGSKRASSTASPTVSGPPDVDGADLYDMGDELPDAKSIMPSTRYGGDDAVSSQPDGADLYDMGDEGFDTKPVTQAQSTNTLETLVEEVRVLFSQIMCPCVCLKKSKKGPGQMRGMSFGHTLNTPRLPHSKQAFILPHHPHQTTNYKHKHCPLTGS